MRPRVATSLRSVGKSDFDVSGLLGLFRAHRLRLATALGGLAPAEWEAQSRCDEWTVHDVARHLADGAAIAVKLTPDGPGPFDDFDPRVTPKGWLEASRDETPAETLARLVSGDEALFDRLQQMIDAGVAFEFAAPYGSVDWTTLMLHLFWDSWLHERDVLFPLGLPHQTDDAEARVAVAYGLLIAAAVSLMFGQPVEHRFDLGGLGGGIFEVASSETVRVHVLAVTGDGPAAVDVADAIAGRDHDPRRLLAAAGAEPAQRMSALSDFFRSPA